MSDFLQNKKRPLEEDDSHPNKYLKTDGFGSIVATHYNEIKETGLDQRNSSRIVCLRNFNNWIKSYFISKYIEEIRNQSADEHKIVAIDLGCGKGGDLLKWQKGRIQHLICADIAEESVQQCNTRFEDMKNKERGRMFSAEFISLDCSKYRLKNRFRDPKMKVDITSCQFALHYSFESLSQAETMIRNAAEPLKKGGYFIATLPDANKIVAELNKREGNLIKNEVFKIEFKDKNPIDGPLFGNVFNFYLEGVVNCPEFLVHFSTLASICKKYGLEPVYRKPFNEVYKEAIKDEDAKRLFFRMKALEMYPGYGEQSQSSNKEYAHAEEYMKEKDQNKVKTISKSEWEAICIYQAVAFKKVT